MLKALLVMPRCKIIGTSCATTKRHWSFKQSRMSHVFFVCAICFLRDMERTTATKRPKLMHNLSLCSFKRQLTARLNILYTLYWDYLFLVRLFGCRLLFLYLIQYLTSFPSVAIREEGHTSSIARSKPWKVPLKDFDQQKAPEATAKLELLNKNSCGDWNRSQNDLVQWLGIGNGWCFSVI